MKTKKETSVSKRQKVYKRKTRKLLTNKPRRLSLEEMSAKERKKMLAILKKTSKKIKKGKIKEVKSFEETEENEIHLKKKETNKKGRRKEENDTTKVIKGRKNHEKSKVIKKKSKPEEDKDDQIKVKKSKRTKTKEIIELDDSNDTEEEIITKKDKKFGKNVTQEMKIVRLSKENKTNLLRTKEKLTEEDIKEYQRKYSFPSSKLRCRDILNQVKIPEGFIPRNDYQRYIKYSESVYQISLIDEYTDDQIFFFTGFTRNEFINLCKVLTHEVKLSVNKETGDCEFIIGNKSSCHLKPNKNKIFTNESYLFIFITLLRIGSDYKTIYYILQLDKIQNKLINKDVTKEGKNPSDLIGRSIEYVRKAFGDEIEHKLVKLFANNENLTISFATMLSREEIESFPLFVHCYYAIDSRTQRVDSQYVLKENKDKKGSKIVTRKENDDERYETIETPFPIEYHRDRKLYSSKTNSSGIKIEITTNYFGFIVAHSLPSPASTHDINLHRMTTKEITMKGKFILGDSGYVSDDPQLLTHIKSTELTASERQDEELKKKRNYFNEIQSRLRIIVENTFARMVKTFKWFKTTPSSKMENIRSIMSMGIGLINYHISIHKLRSKNQIRRVPITVDEFIVMEMRDDLFDTLKEYKGDVTKIEHFESNYKYFIEKAMNVKESELVEDNEREESNNDFVSKMVCDSDRQQEIFDVDDFPDHITIEMVNKSLEVLKKDCWLESDCFSIWFNIMKSTHEMSSCFLLDSFFFEKMSEMKIDENGNENRNDSTIKYRDKMVNLLGSNEYAIILKSFGKHYILYLITFGLDHVIEINKDTKIAKTSCICIFDSLRQTTVVPSEDIYILRNFIYSVQIAKTGERSTVFPFIHEICINVFQQRNNIDCGVHCCFFVEQLMSRNPTSIKTIELFVRQSAVHSFREKMIAEIELFKYKYFK